MKQLLFFFLLATVALAPVCEDGFSWDDSFPMPVMVNQVSAPCAQQPSFREFDFWVGEWDVSANGQKVAESSIQKIIGSCVVYENYLQPDGYLGKSFNFYDSVLKKWRQTWVDSSGNVSEFSGSLKNGAMHYEGESHRQNGQKILRKMIVTPLGADKVRQSSEFSTDEGRTWAVMYDLIYLRKKSAAK